MSIPERSINNRPVAWGSSTKSNGNDYDVLELEGHRAKDKVEERKTSKQNPEEEEEEGKKKGKGGGA